MVKKLSKKEIGRRVQAAYSKVANGVQVPIMATVTIFDAGARAVIAGKSQEEVEAVVKAEVEKVRVN